MTKSCDIFWYIRDVVHHYYTCMMGKSDKKLCDICDKQYTTANISRHRRGMHAYCSECKILVSKKRHPCFKPQHQKREFPTLAPKPEEQFVLIHVPLLIRKSLYKKLESDIALWPLDSDSNGKKLIADIKNNLEKDCVACELCQFFDLPKGVEDHSCRNPSREQFLSALKNSGGEETDVESVDLIYKTMFGDGREFAPNIL